MLTATGCPATLFIELKTKPSPLKSNKNQPLTGTMALVVLSISLKLIFKLGFNKQTSLTKSMLSIDAFISHDLGSEVVVVDLLLFKIVTVGAEV